MSFDPALLLRMGGDDLTAVPSPFVHPESL